MSEANPCASHEALRAPAGGASASNTRHSAHFVWAAAWMANSTSRRCVGCAAKTCSQPPHTHAARKASRHTFSASVSAIGSVDPRCRTRALRARVCYQDTSSSRSDDSPTTSRVSRTQSCLPAFVLRQVFKESICAWKLRQERRVFEVARGSRARWCSLNSPRPQSRRAGWPSAGSA